MEKRTPAEEVYKGIGQKITYFRKELKLTQQELADKINSTRQTIALYELGVRRIPLVTLISISKALNTSLNELIPDLEKSKPGPTSKIDSNLAKVKALPPKQQKIIIDMIDSVIRNTP